MSSSNNIKNDQYNKKCKVSETLSKKCYTDITNTLETPNSLHLDTVRSLLQIYTKDMKKEDKYKINFKSDNTIKYISNYKLQDKLLNDTVPKDGMYNENIKEDDFIDLVNAKDTKKLLFNNGSINDNRLKIQEYTKLFFLMGGNENGINKENLARCLAMAVNFYEKPEVTLMSENNDKNYNDYMNNADEIIRLLGKDKTDSLSIEDFINVMTLDGEFPDDGLNL